MSLRQSRELQSDDNRQLLLLAEYTLTALALVGFACNSETSLVITMTTDDVMRPVAAPLVLRVREHGWRAGCLGQGAICGLACVYWSIRLPHVPVLR